MDWNKLAKAVASHGRNGDSTLAHVNSDELKMLKARGGAGSVNPTTGLYEFYDDPGAGGSPGLGAGSGTGPGGLSAAEGTATQSEGKSPNAIDWTNGFSASGLYDKFTGAFNHSGPSWSSDPAAKGIQTAAGAMLPGFGMLSTGGKAFAAGMEMLGGKGMSDTQANSQGQSYQGSFGDNSTSLTQPVPDTSTITAPVAATPPAGTGQNLSGLANTHGLPPSVLDYLIRLGVVSL